MTDTTLVEITENEARVITTALRTILEVAPKDAPEREWLASAESKMLDAYLKIANKEKP